MDKSEERVEEIRKRVMLSMCTTWSVRGETVEARISAKDFTDLMQHIDRMDKALKFYGNRLHWMQLGGDDGPELVLSAMSGPSPFSGWSVAEEALK